MKKSRIRVNYVDFILAGLFLIILATLISMFFSRSAIVDITSKDTITVTFKISGINDEHKGLIKENENVYIGDGDVSFGKIKSVKYHTEPMILSPATDSAKHPVLIKDISSDTNRDFTYTAIIEVECQGLINVSEFETANQSYKINDVLDFCVLEYSSKASIINFE